MIANQCDDDDLEKHHTLSPMITPEKQKDDERISSSDQYSCK
jgi:hypothetical protein